MQTFTITSPNTCALVVVGPNISYVEADPAAEIFASDSATFTEYLTSQDAAAAALVINPSYNTSIILGPIPYTVDTETGSGDYFYGDTVTLDFVVSSSLAGTVITYQWYDEGGLAIPGETSSSLSLGNASSLIAGGYSCEATLVSTDGRTQTAGATFSVTVYPVVGSFSLTRSGNNLTSGLFTYVKGFTATTAILKVPSSSLIINYDSADGFKTTGSPLTAGDHAAQLFIGDAFVTSITIYAGNGTYNYNFSA